MPCALYLQYIPVGAEIVGIGADDLEEISDAEADDEYYKLGAEDEQFKDYASLALKPDHANRWHCKISAHHAHHAQRSYVQPRN